MALDHDFCIILGFMFGFFAFIVVIGYIGIVYRIASETKTEVIALKGLTNMQPPVEPIQNFDERSDNNEVS